MNGCTYFRNRIDEAEKSDLFPFDVSEHIGQCAECERFASERSALRLLLAGGERVSAPINFDALLKARLAEVKGRSAFWWLSSPGFLRLAAATTGVVAMLVVAQYTGWLSNGGPQPSVKQLATQDTPLVPTPTPPQLVQIPAAPPELPVTVGVVRPGQVRRLSAERRPARVDTAMSAEYVTAEDGGVVLLRGRNGDMDVQMPTVSVGAQPLLYVSAGQKTARSVGTSF